MKEVTITINKYPGSIIITDRESKENFIIDCVRDPSELFKFLCNNLDTDKFIVSFLIGTGLSMDSLEDLTAYELEQIENLVKTTINRRRNEITEEQES